MPRASGSLAAQCGDLRYGRVGGVQARPGGQPGQQGGGVAGRQRVEADKPGVFQRGQVPAAGDQYQGIAGTGQQRPDLVAAGGVVKEQQQALAAHAVAPHAGPRLHAGRDLRGRDPDGLQQAGQGVGGLYRLLSGGMRVQRQEDLPVGEPRGQLAGGADRERGLADPGHPADHPDAARPGSGLKLAQLTSPAGERGDVPRQRPGCRRGAGARVTAARGGQEPGPLLFAQGQRVGEQPGGLIAGRQVDAPFEVTDRPGAQRRRLGEFFLAQPGAGPQLPQQLPELRHRRSLVQYSPRAHRAARHARAGRSRAAASTLGAGPAHRGHDGEYVGILWLSLIAVPGGRP